MPPPLCQSTMKVLPSGSTRCSPFTLFPQGKAFHFLVIKCHIDTFCSHLYCSNSPQTWYLRRMLHRESICEREALSVLLVGNSTLINQQKILNKAYLNINILNMATYWSTDKKNIVARGWRTCSESSWMNTYENLTEHSRWANEICSSVTIYLMLIDPQHLRVLPPFCSIPLLSPFSWSWVSIQLGWNIRHCVQQCNLGAEPAEGACPCPCLHLSVLCWDRQASVEWHWGWISYVNLIRPKWPRELVKHY